MSYEKYLNEMKEIHSKFLILIEREDNCEENYQNLINCIHDKQFDNNKHEFKSILYMISSISTYHYRGLNFFPKIEQVFINYKTFITANFTNVELFNVFKKNKVLLLLLIQNKIILFDNAIYDKILEIDNKKYRSYEGYFRPEIHNYDTTENETRKLGENVQNLCQIIRNDLIEEFIIFVNKNDYPLNSKIEYSKYESHPLLIEYNINLIEYAVFFGSVQIFKYLYLNGVKLTKKLWIYCIYGNNEEIFHILEENVQSNINIYSKCYFEAIKCHHNEMAKYIESNYLNIENNFTIKTNSCIFKYYNFLLLPEKFESHFLFIDACKYDHYKIVEYLFKFKEYDIHDLSIYY